MHMRNEVTLVWGELKLAPTKTETTFFFVNNHRSVPLTRPPPILYTTSCLKCGGGLIFEDAISLDYKPPTKRFYASAMYAIRTLPKLMFT